MRDDTNYTPVGTNTAPVSNQLPDIDQDVIDARVSEIVETTVLPERKARWFVLRVEYGLRRPQIAEQMGVSKYTVDDHRKGAKDRLEKAQQTCELLESREVDLDAL